jgi:hypothetical protein
MLRLHHKALIDRHYRGALIAFHNRTYLVPETIIRALEHGDLSIDAVDPRLRPMLRQMQREGICVVASAAEMPAGPA